VVGLAPLGPLRRRPVGGGGRGSPRWTSTTSTACREGRQGGRRSRFTWAFKHEAMRSGDYLSAIADDLKAIEAMGGRPRGLGQSHSWVPGGTLMLALSGIGDRAGTEADVVTGGPRRRRREHDHRVRRARHPLIPHPLVADRAQARSTTTASPHTLIGIARDKGVSGLRRRAGPTAGPPVHTLGRRAAVTGWRLSRHRPARGLHGVADEGVAVQGHRRGHRPAPLAPARQERRPAGRGRPLRLPRELRRTSTTGRRARSPGQLLAWEPAREGLIDDLTHGPLLRQRVRKKSGIVGPPSWSSGLPGRRGVQGLDLVGG